MKSSVIWIGFSIRCTRNSSETHSGRSGSARKTRTRPSGSSNRSVKRWTACASSCMTSSRSYQAPHCVSQQYHSDFSEKDNHHHNNQERPPPLPPPQQQHNNDNNDDVLRADTTGEGELCELLRAAGDKAHESTVAVQNLIECARENSDLLGDLLGDLRGDLPAVLPSQTTRTQGGRRSSTSAHVKGGQARHDENAHHGDHAGKDGEGEEEVGSRSGAVEAEMEGANHISETSLSFRHLSDIS